MLQKEILAKLCALHQGTENQLRARTSVFWRGLYKVIEETTKACCICEELQYSRQSRYPTGHVYTTGADLFTHDGSKYLHLVTADYYFKYPFVRQTDSQCAKQNQHRLENNETASYRKQGIPKLVRTKNGLDFNGLVFQELAQELNFENITSSPHYPHYNGFIKAKSVKSAEVKFDQAKSDFDMLLLCLGGTHGDH